MPNGTLRIATYNCENLFSRPKIFELDSEKSQQLLSYYNQLVEELCKMIFDHPKIDDLKTKLSGVAVVRDIRGSHKKAKGAKDWSGYAELIRTEINEIAEMNTARVISDIDADVIMLIEVENRILLQKFHDEMIYLNFLKEQGKEPYKYIQLIEGNDDRGINVSVMSRLPIVCMRSHIHERTTYEGEKVPLFSRDCLEVMVYTKERPVYLLVNHLKSMGYNIPTDPLSNKRRYIQAKRVSEIASKYDFTKDYVVVGGDLNSDVSSPALTPLLTMPNLYNANNELPPDMRGTYRTGSAQLDYLLVSEAIRKNLNNVHIERRGVYTKKGEHYETILDRKTEASDHAAVVMEFKL